MVRNVCIVMGLVFIVTGIWGFADGERVLIFHVNATHNFIHLLSGIVALVCGLTRQSAALGFAFTFAAIYGLVTILGFLNFEPLVDALNLNQADNWLHFGITAVFLAAALSELPAWRHGTPPTAGIGPTGTPQPR